MICFGRSGQSVCGDGEPNLGAAHPGPACHSAERKVRAVGLAFNPQSDSGSGRSVPAQGLICDFVTYTRGHRCPIRYSLKGILLEAPQVGRPVKVFRLERNGLQVVGYYEPTPVIRLTVDGSVTKNSCYWLRRLEQP